MVFGTQPKVVKFLLYGSFASTGEGHGTKQALLAGILGMQPDDERIPRSFEIAEKVGVEFSFGECSLRDVHPNSVLVCMYDKKGAKVEIGASSLGGGRIQVFQINDLRISFSAELPTLLVTNRDTPGCVSLVTALLAREQINVATLQLSRAGRGETAMMVIECDSPVPETLVTALRDMPDIMAVTSFSPEANL